MYHSFECFQKLTDISKKYHNYSLIHTQANKTPCINQNLPKEQYATHQNKKGKTSHDNDFNFFAETSNFDLENNVHSVVKIRMNMKMKVKMMISESSNILWMVIIMLCNEI